jgi:hypothetical protein
MESNIQTNSNQKETQEQENNSNGNYNSQENNQDNSVIDHQNSNYQANENNQNESEQYINTFNPTYQNYNYSNNTPGSPSESQSTYNKDSESKSTFNANAFPGDKPWNRAAKDPTIVQKGTELFVGNLSMDSVEEELYENFQECGEIIDVFKIFLFCILSFLYFSLILTLKFRFAFTEMNRIKNAMRF